MTSWIRRRNSFYLGAMVAVASCLQTATVASAQAEATVGGEALDTTGLGQASANLPIAHPIRESIDEVYRLATGAKTVGQLDRALTKSRQVAEGTLSDEDALYLKKLQGWLINRRGEAHATAAGRAMDAGRQGEAVALEEKAIQDFNSAIKHDPHWRPYHNRGVSFAMLNQYDQAISSFTESIERNPTYRDTRFNRAELWLETGQYELAEQDYNQVVQMDEKDFHALMGRGHARFYRSRFDEALADFDAAIALQPKHAVVHADRADLHAFMGHWEQAAQDYRMAIKLDRGLARAYQSAAWLMATCPEDRYRDEPLALKAAERAVELEGTADYRYLDTLAAAQANAKQFKAAIETVQQAMQAAPAELQPELKQRLELYRAGRPFRDQPR